ncbi:MAG: PQQ-binding-like beta-propeller repeat protein [Phycisphaerae bacterium]|nr:PQQ-binding-like beta-propeller repeat protein [Phycisphaerae bacterium]
MHTYRVGLAALAISCSACFGGDWRHWRGPAYNGSSDEKHLPASWSKTENVTWVRPLPGPSAATPIISGGRVFISSMAGTKHGLLGICVDRRDGKVLWQKSLGTGRWVPDNNMASCSPVTDGKKVFFLYGTGDLAGLDFGGKVIWSRSLEKDYGRFGIKYAYSASPLLHAGKLYVAVLRRDMDYRMPSGKKVRLDSFLLALDPDTGKTIWKHARTTDAISESQDSYSSPIPCQIGGRDGILVSGADYMTCHDARTGKEIWRYRYVSRKHWLYRLVPSPLVTGGLVCGVVPRGKSVFGLDPLKKDKSGRAALAWKLDKGPDICTPLYYKGLLYVLDGQRKELACLDLAAEKLLWRKTLGGRTTFRASPTGADDKIYCINMRGEVTVLAAGRKLKELARFSMGERNLMASIAAADGALFIRSPKKLYCIEKKEGLRPLGREGPAAR